VDSSAVSKVSGNNLDPLVDGSHSVWVQSTDSAGNTGYASVNFTIDTMPPITTASPAEGFYNAIQNITLTTNETATIYYTTDGTMPSTASFVYHAPIATATTTTLSYFSIDQAGNSECLQGLPHIR
jgi:hypothetical protein